MVCNTLHLIGNSCVCIIRVALYPTTRIEMVAAAASRRLAVASQRFSSSFIIDVGHCLSLFVVAAQRLRRPLRGAWPLLRNVSRHRSLLVGHCCSLFVVARNGWPLRGAWPLLARGPPTSEELRSVGLLRLHRVILNRPSNLINFRGHNI